MKAAWPRLLGLLLALLAGPLPSSGQTVISYNASGHLQTIGPGSNAPPVILGHPRSSVASVSGNIFLSVAAMGSPPLAFQWQFNSNNVPGEIGDSLILTNITLGRFGAYRVVVSNAFGSVTSSNAVLDLDSDGDGLADSWENQYFGSITNRSGSADYDRDGVADLDEFLDGTNPTNSVALRPRLTLAGLNGSVSALPDLDKYNPGQQVSVSVTPHAGFQFVGWSGDLLGTNNPATTAMDSNKSITAVCSLPLPFTLNTTNITWRSGGDVPWFGQNYVAQDGVAAAQNGPLRIDQVSWLEATIYMSGEGVVTFWWKRILSGGSTLTFTINGIEHSFYTPQSFWDEVTYYLPAGTSVIRWSYEKVSEFSLGFDAVWVDKVATKVYPDPLADTEGDGLADLWEYKYFGHLFNVGISDADGDGVNNHNEYVDGTDPFDQTSASPRLVISTSGGTVTPSPALEKYSYLQQVTLTASANPGFTFVRWLGDLSGSTNPATIVMDRSKAVSAVFARSLPNGIAEALDATNFIWTAGGDALFFNQSLTTHDNVDAAHSPLLAPSQQAWVQTTINGPGPLSFWWKASSSFGNFRFLLNGAQQRSIAGNADWSQFSLNLPAGANTLRWSFEKGTFAGAPNDTAWLDQVVFGTNAPSISIPPISRNIVQGSNVIFSVTASSSAPLSYRWQRNGVDLSNGPFVSGATTATLTLSNVQPNEAGTYTVLVSTPANTVSSAASLAVAAIVPLPEALDTPGRVWISGGATPWLGQDLTRHDGVDAGQSGGIGAGQESWLESSFTGPGALNFWWKLSGSAGVNRFEFLVDGITNTTLSGDIDWAPRSFPLSPGTHTVRWRYAQNSASPITVQSAWLDQVALIAGTPPAITAHPLSQTVTGGVNVSFSVSASGTGPLTYRWFFNQTNLIGSNSATLSLTSVQLANAGPYSVLVSNAIGKVASANADLIVHVRPFITAQPLGGTVVVGSDIALSVAAGGAAPLHFQWRKDGANIAGATQPDLVLTNLQASQSGGYTVVVSNFLGSITSVVAQLAVGMPPFITTQPLDQNANLGATVTFSVVASGTAPLFYQWSKNGIEMPGRTAPNLSLTNVQFSDQGSYEVAVSNLFGTITSDSAFLSIGFSTPLTIVTQPASQTVQPGGTASFTVVAFGDAPLFYQWRRFGTNLPGANAASLTLTNVQAADGGPYTVVVSNFTESVTSVVAVLTVGGSGPVLSLGISNMAVRLQWNAVAGRSYQVQYKNHLVVTSWSNLPPVIDATGPLAFATDPFGSFPQRYYRVELLPQQNIPPTITAQPVSQTVSPGANVTFSVTAEGSAPLQYQWRFNGEDLPGATASTLQLLNVQFDDIGIYDVVVTNPAGAATSDPVFLIVF